MQHARTRLTAFQWRGSKLSAHHSVVESQVGLCSVDAEKRGHTMTDGNLLREKREEILRICAKYGARNVRIFGSVARGEADKHSDIDFLVEMEAGRSLFDLGGLQYELEQMLGCPVDVVTERGIKARIRERVLREVVPL